jgi:Zn-finger nucleic acid-binding protein
MALRGNEDLRIDVCVWCGGVFLDPGELERLARLGRSGAPPRRAEAFSLPSTGVPGNDWPWWFRALLDLVS